VCVCVCVCVCVRAWYVCARADVNALRIVCVCVRACARAEVSGLRM
jgi:hypothetical protein